MYAKSSEIIYCCPNVNERIVDYQMLKVLCSFCPWMNNMPIYQVQITSVNGSALVEFRTKFVTGCKAYEQNSFPWPNILPITIRKSVCQDNFVEGPFRETSQFYLFYLDLYLCQRIKILTYVILRTC